tara:strand:+ start:351 stop:1517 length:1167 start_codon:yes stop_codon:yes gene_type:complete
MSNKKENNVWYHGTPDVRELQQDGGFTQRHIDIEYVEDIDKWNNTQEALRLARESNNDKEYSSLLDSIKDLRKKASIRKPIFLTDIHSVAKTYADPQRAFDYQNSVEKVLKVSTKGNKGVTIIAPGSRFRFIDIKNVKQGFINAGVSEERFDSIAAQLNYALGVEKGIKTNSIAAMADWLGFDYVDVVGVLDSYHGGSTKSTVRMVFDPNNISIVKEDGREALKESVREIIKESFTEDISQDAIAYHVSPVNFDKFDFSKAGSRQGAHRKFAKDVGVFFTKDQWSIDWMKDVIARDGIPSYVYKCKLSYNKPYTLNDFYSMINKIYGDGYGEKLVNRVGFWNAYDQETSDILGDALEKGCDSIVFGDFIVMFEVSTVEILDIEVNDSE